MKLKFVLGSFVSLFTFSFSYAQEEISLEQVIRLALEKNYDVQIAKAFSEGTSVDRDYSWGAFLPQISATGSNTINNNTQELRVRDRTTNEIVPLEGPTASNSLNGSVQLAWTLFDGTRMFATRERIAALADQGELLVKDQMTNTIATIISGYYDIVRQKQQLKAIQEQMSVSEERVKLAERKLEVGTGVKPELLQARVDYNAQRSQVVQQESVIVQLKEQLNALVGMQLPPVYDVADSILIDLHLNPDELSGNLESTNFGLQAYGENVRIANLSLRERRAEYLPFLNFNAAYSYSKTNNTKLLNPYGTFFSQQTGYNYGFSVNFPILTGFNTRRLNQRARIEINRQTLLYNQYKTNLDVGLRNAYISYENAKKILAIQEENINLAKENVNIALESFKRGVTTFIELRTAQQSLETAYNNLIAARYNTKVAETEVLRLSGKLLK